MADAVASWVKSRYVCAEHTNRPVTHFGKGCPDCAARRVDARRRRIARRKAAGQPPAGLAA